MKKVSSFTFYFLFFAANAALLPFIVIYYQSRDFTGIQIGILTSLSPLLSLVGAPFWTGVADATRRHRLIISLAIGVGVLGGMLFPFLAAFLPILILAVIFSFFTAPISSLADSATMTILEGRRDLYGRLRLGGTFGWGICAPLVGLLVESQGLRIAFWTFAALMFLALLVSQNFTFQRAQEGVSLQKGARTLLANRRYLLFLIQALICGIGFSSVNVYLFAYMQEQGISQSLMGVALTIATLAELPVLFFSNRLLKRFHAHGLLALGMGTTGIRLLLYAVFTTPVGVLAFQILNGFTFPLVWVAGVSYADENAPSGLSASAQGLFGAMIFGFGSAVGGMSGSLLLESLGGRMMYLVIGLIVLTGLGVISLLEHRKMMPSATPLP